jgi:hypothetical protein
MQIEDFLRRVVPAAGNYLNVTYNKEPHTRNKKTWSYRSFPLARLNDAAGFIRWGAAKGFEMYHALAAFKAGTLRTNAQGQQWMDVRREQANVHLIQTLVIDADVSRVGDGKAANMVFATKHDALAWCLTFCQTINLPRPNLCVSSGYGLHFYWVLDTALTRDQWQPLADALRAAMQVHAWVGDVSPTVDSARILRPPETWNQKGAVGVAVEVLPRFTAPDYAVSLITQALQPFIGVSAPRSGTPGGATVHPINLGPKPAHAGASVNVGANASVGITKREYNVSVIATRCAQVASSLANHGNGDQYPLWYRGHLTLFDFCVDGDDYVHPISDGDPRYDPQNVDNHKAAIKAELAAKPHLGAPLCASYDTYRKGICDQCPFWGQIKSPLTLGVASDPDELPPNYRRMDTPQRIEHFEGDNKTGQWKLLMLGDVKSPELHVLDGGGRRIVFLYEMAGVAKLSVLNDFDLGGGPGQHNLLRKQNLPTDRHSCGPVGDFILAWINKLRAQHAVTVDVVQPYGWHYNLQGELTGLAIAGNYYRRDGTMQLVAGGDPIMNHLYTAKGTMDNWRTAAALFEGEHPALQLIIALSFAAPLVALLGDVRGMSWNFHGSSGTGKTSAIKVGQAVWADFTMIQSMKDSPNSVMHALTMPKILTRYWDEMQVAKDEKQQFYDLIFSLPVGREKTRLTSDIKLREAGSWETMLVMSSNRSYWDYLTDINMGTDAAILRLFECPVLKQDRPDMPGVGLKLKATEKNYGHAGAVYAQWLAANLDRVRDDLQKARELLRRELGTQDDERFFLTGMVCAILGAKYARKLRLFDFDLAGVFGYLKDCFARMRVARGLQVMVEATGEYDLERVMGQYLAAQSDYQLHTVGAASHSAKQVPTTVEPRGQEVRVHISEQPPMLRFTTESFRLWCQDHNHANSAIVAQLKMNWGAVETRGYLGAGTNYKQLMKSTQLHIPLVGALSQGLQNLQLVPTPPRAAGPAVPTPGNQVKL